MDKIINQSVAVVLSTLLITGGLWAEDPPQAPEPAQAQATTPAATFTADQINSLVAPIALYPDELVSQILVASTYPLEVVQAYQWIQQHPELKGQELTGAAQKQSWDPSVQALVAFPDVLKRMNQDVTWTTNLGNAFLASQSNVMDCIQQMRTRAQTAGKLTSTDQQKVTSTTQEGRQVVVIEPANPEIVYVPDYDPVWIWGASPYYPYPGWYYPPPPPVGYWCWWGPRISVGLYFSSWGGWGGYGWRPQWGSRTVIVNRNFVTVNHFNNVRVAHGGVWAHEPSHRMGVSYPNRALSSQFRPVGRPIVNHVTVNQAREQFHAAAVRTPAERFGNRQISPNAYNGNHTAFGGMNAGNNARAHSNRGFSSMGRAPGARTSGGHGASAPAGRAGGDAHSAGDAGGHAGGGDGGGHMGGGGEGGGRGGGFGGGNRGGGHR